MPLLGLFAFAVAAAYVVSVLGPKPRPATLDSSQLQAVQSAAQQGAQSALPVGASPLPGQVFEPGFQGQPGASVSGVLFDRGERLPTGHKVLRDWRGCPHVVIGSEA